MAGVVSLLGIGGSAGAFEIPTGNSDVVLRWDNTLRYTLANRIKKQDQTIINNPNTDDGDRNFNVGIVSNRLDILSEADFVYKERYGARVSASGWYDQRYDAPLDNTSLATSNHMQDGHAAKGYSSFVDRYYRGPDGELLDAFVFAGFDVAGMPLNIKVGRHTNYWGESLMLNGNIHGIAYAQSPLDGSKYFGQPGAEAKELFRPLNNVSAQLQVSNALSIAGMYYLQYETNKFPEAGSYLGFHDVLMNGSESLITGANPFGPGYARVTRGKDILPKENGDWGISARWAPEWLNGSAGLYYRNFSDKFWQLHVTPGGAFNPSILDPANGVVGRYNMAYADNIELFGASYATTLLGVSIGSEISYRKNMPLMSDPVFVLPQGLPAAAYPPGAITALPGRGETGGARGNTWHAVVNFLGLINKTPLFDSATWNTEFTYSRVDKVTQGGAVYKGRDGYNEIDKTTRDYIGGSAGFTATWFQVLPGVDLTMPLSVMSGLVGNSAVTLGGNKNAGAYSAGLGADIFNKYKVDLKYTDYFGEYGSNQADPASAPVARSLYSMLSDRGFLSLTLKATF